VLQYLPCILLGVHSASLLSYSCVRDCMWSTCGWSWPALLQWLAGIIASFLSNAALTIIGWVVSGRVLIGVSVDRESASQDTSHQSNTGGRLSNLIKHLKAFRGTTDNNNYTIYLKIHTQNLSEIQSWAMTLWRTCTIASNTTQTQSLIFLSSMHVAI